MDNRLQAIRSLMEEQKLTGSFFFNIAISIISSPPLAGTTDWWLPGTGFVQSPRTLTEASPGGVELVKT